MGTTARMRSAVFLAGFGGIVAQVMVLREMVVTFYGNELSLGVMLGTWLLWTGFGSLGLGRLARRLRRPGLWLGVGLGAMAALLVATVGGARGLKVVLKASEGASLGQIRPFGTMLVSALALLAPFCLVNGFLFPLACRAAEAAGESVGTVYLLEAAGAALGGASYTFLLVGWLGAPQVFRRLDDAYWHPLKVVHLADSRYGRLTVTAHDAESPQRTLYVNGALAFSYPDPPVAEAIAHLPLLEHPAPGRVLLLGGGLGGAAAEALKHPTVRRVTCVELDPAAVAAVRGAFPRGAWAPLEDARAELVVGDGRAFLKQTRERFDVVIAAQGPPATAQANRFYTAEFFREAARVLEPGGVFAFRATGWHDYLGDDTRRLLASLRRTLGAAFPHVLMFPGANCTFLASNREGVLTYRLGVLGERIAERGLELWHVDERGWEAELLRLEELEAALAAETAAVVNRDLRPRCYYYEAQRWSAVQRARRPGRPGAGLDLAGVLDFFGRYPLVAPLGVLVLVGGLSLAAPIARRRWRDGALAFSVASTGLIEMGVEFAVILGFQVACGYLYQYVGAVVAAFMVGLALGAWGSSRWVRAGRASWGRMVGVQACICVYPLVLLGFLWLSSGARLAAWPGLAGVLFSLAALLAGLVGGLQFPLAVALHSGGTGSAGTLYGLDLFGSCLGALAVSSVLVPSFGLDGVCAMLGGLGVLGLGGLLAAGRGRTGVDFAGGGR